MRSVEQDVPVRLYRLIVAARSLLQPVTCTTACRQALEERQDALSHEMQSLEEDRSLLRQYRDTDTVVVRAGVGAQVERARSDTASPVYLAVRQLHIVGDVVCKAMSLPAKACRDCHANSVQIREHEHAGSIYNISSPVTATAAYMYMQPATVWC